SQIKTNEADGYDAIQLACAPKKAKNSNKAEKGHLAGAGFENGAKFVKELRQAAPEGAAVGAQLSIDSLVKGDVVKLTSKSKGKGFAGTVKRWNFRTQDATHGNSLSHRVPGSIGQNQTPGKVFKGKKMAGQLGNERVTVQSLDVVRVDAERNLLLVKGGVPGATGCDLIVKPAVKA
ncbi:50S ribosomal protein L3, partial [Bacillus cereus]|nr:50S ribosomal protein L3 [Bacillus cereus]